jgi:hypothetical protein
VRRLLAIAFVAMLVASAAPAVSKVAATSGQLGISTPEVQLGTSPPGTVVSDTDIPVRTTGQLTVSFRGDQATGCAARGLCGYSGTVIWQPARSGDLSVGTTRFHGKLEHNVELFLTGQNPPFGPNSGDVTTANVHFAPDSGADSDCADATATGSDFSIPIHGQAARASLIRSLPDVLRTRCAGPLVSDLGRLDIGSSIAVSALLRGRRTVALGSSGTFAANGFAGTASSTVALILGKPSTQPQSRRRRPSRRSISLRTVEVDYRASLAGRLTLRTHGDPASCAPLGACGANGAFSIRPEGRGTLELEATTRASRPLRDALAALGLRPGGNPRGIGAFGTFVPDRLGRADVTVTQGPNTCHDSGPEASGAMILTVSGGAFSVRDIAEISALGLRCPGPLLVSGTTIASGTGPASILGHSPATIPLRGNTVLTDDGYAGRALSDLTLTLSHPRVKTHVQSLVIG